ncbi:cbb3-type cytochrome c oxidase subunit I [Candidatus Nitrosacidococcus tergens]|uniref:Cytochrome c oxidase, subunit I n=1 Tax=Candidatus Nitrosacidococcus tergens TaxID=553981 RepID=A0A7G1Q7F8_9GAMM|nr:cbb3-type cytochrome c oxidase subunit I [Candidatus Nitrosacidococcus tergens]CAB1274375.1 Cytochrome c oxidase, subunit I [Candidatus Nitrosacidococcus tergens]
MTTNSDIVNYSDTENRSALVAVKTHIITGFLVFLLMMAAGATMRAAQGKLAGVDDSLFYQIMTMHGVGVVGISGIVGFSIMWYFLRQYVPLNLKIFWINFYIFLTGVVIILASIFVGGYAGAWTFLYPLPTTSLGVWSVGAAIGFLSGLLLIGVGFLILLLDIARGLLSRYGSLARALGVTQLFGKDPLDTHHPTTVTISTVVLIVDFIGIAAGAVALIIMLINAVNPEFKPDPLLVKNLIYFFGHVIINAAIYSSVPAVYELLPRYTKRPYHTSKVFYAAWFVAVFTIMGVYPHHLYMDFPMPAWAVIAGQVLSYCSGLPVMIVTGYGTLMMVYRSGIQWSTPAKLLVLSIFGWAAGGIPAVVDSMMAFNSVLHNTLWVPGHFHFYLLLGLLPMIIGFTFYLFSTPEDEANPPLIEKLAVYTYVTGVLMLVLVFLTSGAHGIPRRWAVHMDPWVPYAQWGAIAGVLVTLGLLLFAVRVFTKLPKATDPALEYSRH